MRGIWINFLGHSPKIWCVLTCVSRLSSHLIKYLTKTADNVGNKEGNPAEKEDPHDDSDCDCGLVLLHQTVAHLGPGDPAPPRPLGRHPPAVSLGAKWSRHGVLAVLNWLYFGQQFATMKPELNITSELMRCLWENILLINLSWMCYRIGWRMFYYFHKMEIHSI